MNFTRFVAAKSTSKGAYEKSRKFAVHEHLDPKICAHACKYTGKLPQTIA